MSNSLENQEIVKKVFITYLEENNLPNEFKYFDPTKALENRECGLHA